MVKDEKNLVLNIDKDIIEKFLKLARDRYHQVDKANYFLESNTNISGSNIAITNQRDFLSHLCTLLQNPKLSRDQQLDQISSAEEHLRRAIIESYQLVVSIKQKDIDTLIQNYIKLVVPIQRKEPTLSSALTIQTIRKRQDEIKELKTKGRTAKSRNTWDEEWEQGVKVLLEAFVKAKNLEEELEKYIIRAQQRSDNKTQIWLASWGIIATVIVFILSLVLMIQ
jgi:hypothetical protein